LHSLGIFHRDIKVIVCEKFSRLTFFSMMRISPNLETWTYRKYQSLGSVWLKLEHHIMPVL